PLQLHHRRPHGHHPGHPLGGHPSARYVLHRVALPLRGHGLHHDRLHRRRALLVAQDDRQDVQRDGGPHRRHPRLHRLQHHLFRATCHGFAGQPSPLLPLHEPVPDSPSDFHHRHRDSGHGP